MSEVNRVVPLSRPHLADILGLAGGALRRCAAAARGWPDRTLHAFRRARARRRVGRLAPVRSVLMVCHGNICRSPFAAAVLASAARAEPGNITVRSAGFVGPHRQPPEAALRAAQRRHLDLSQHTSTLVSRESVLEADVVCVMEAAQASLLKARFGLRDINILVLGDLDPLPVRRRTIVDPWGSGDDVFEASYDRIERCVREFVQLLETFASHSRGRER